MGTRGIMGVRIDGHDKLTYNHWDSYPSGLGQNMVEDIEKLLADGGVESFRAKARALRAVDQDSTPTDADIKKLEPYANEDVSSGKKDEWYVLLRNLQGKLADSLYAGVVIDSHTFVKDSLFCEWGYIANLDDQTFEVYKGFQREEHRNGRYALLPVKKETKPGFDTYYPIALIATIPFSELGDNWQSRLPKDPDEEEEEPAAAPAPAKPGGDPFSID